MTQHSASSTSAASQGGEDSGAIILAAGIAETPWLPGCCAKGQCHTLCARTRCSACASSAARGLSLPITCRLHRTPTQGAAALYLSKAAE